MINSLLCLSGGTILVAKNREEDNERLEEEIGENRDDMNRMLEAFRRRERELQDDMENITHKNGMLSDLLNLVTERAESTQKELDRYRKELVRGGPGEILNGFDDSAANVSSTKIEDLKSLEVFKQCGTIFIHYVNKTIFKHYSNII